MALIVNASRRICWERNVDCPAGLKTSAAYDAALYEEMGKPSRGVLVISVVCSFNFKNGKADGGGELAWSGTEKADFMAKFRGDVARVWDEKFRLTTRSTVPAVQDVGVIFDIRPQEDMSITDHSHWNMDVTKVGKFSTSTVCTCGGGTFWNGDVTLDSLDFRAENKGGPNTQRGAVHEFGHMLGHRDEYPEAKTNLSWVADKDAVMNAGEQVRKRHYAMFAAWLTTKYRDNAIRARKSIVWKVEDETTIDNASL